MLLVYRLKSTGRLQLMDLMTIIEKDHLLGADLLLGERALRRSIPMWELLEPWDPLSFLINLPLIQPWGLSSNKSLSLPLRSPSNLSLSLLPLISPPDFKGVGGCMHRTFVSWALLVFTVCMQIKKRNKGKGNNTWNRFNLEYKGWSESERSDARALISNARLKLASLTHAWIQILKRLKSS